jgi:hypothetical protein
LIPVCGGFLWLPAVIVGFGFNGCFAVFQSTAAEDPEVSVEHIGTAIGLMLTIAAVGTEQLVTVLQDLLGASSRRRVPEERDDH